MSLLKCVTFNLSSFYQCFFFFPSIFHPHLVAHSWNERARRKSSSCWMSFIKQTREGEVLLWQPNKCHIKQANTSVYFRFLFFLFSANICDCGLFFFHFIFMVCSSSQMKDLQQSHWDLLHRNPFYCSFRGCFSHMSDFKIKRVPSIALQSLHSSCRDNAQLASASNVT